MLYVGGKKECFDYFSTQLELVSMKQRLHGWQNLPAAVHQDPDAKGEAHQTPPALVQQDQLHFGSARPELPPPLVKTDLRREYKQFHSIFF